MLYKLHINIFIVGFLTIGFIAAMVMEKVLCLMTFAPLVAFITQVGLMLYFSRDTDTEYSDKTLFSVVFSYTFLLGVFFMLLSIYYDDDTFVFNKADAMFYYSEAIKVNDLGLMGVLEYITGKYKFDDWGALVFDSVMLYIIPSKLFVNFVYTILGAISSVYIYRIGRNFMPSSYAFLAALAYSTSSYVVFLNCSFLKESLFSFLVISVMYHQYNAIYKNSMKSLIGVGLFIVLIFFFRPAVAAFLACSIFAYYGITLKNNAISLFLYIAALGVIAVSMNSIIEIFNKNTAGGDVDTMIGETNNSSYSGGFNYFVSMFGAFTGPFPTIFSKVTGPTYLEFLSAGLVYKLFLIFPFWYGVYLVFRKKVIEMFPLTLFVIIELLLTGMVMASLELRKVILHIPFMFVLAYYGMYKGMTPANLNRFTNSIAYVLVIGIMFLWNVIKVKD